MADGLTVNTTCRIFLRELREEDVDERYVSWFEQPDALLDFYSGSGRSFTRHSLLAELKDALLGRTVFFYAIVHRASGQVIGNVKLGPINKRHKTSDLATLIGDRAYLRKGLGAEAVALGNAVAFGQHDIRKLFSGMYAANIASIKAYAAAGWTIEGTLKGQYLVDGKAMDRVLMACFNPKYFPDTPQVRP
jgi:[ribosomal protein S5]-alanine N-acetyltransferase